MTGRPNVKSELDQVRRSKVAMIQYEYSVKLGNWGKLHSFIIAGGCWRV